MADDKIVNGDTSNAGENNDDTTVITPNDTDTEEVKALKETNARLFERAKKAEGFVKQADGTWIKKPEVAPKPANPAPETKVDNSTSQGISEDKLWEVADYIREGYSREDVDFIMKNGGRTALSDPNSLVSLALKSKKEQLNAEQAASRTSDNSQLTEVERKYTPEQLKAMPLAKLKEILPKA